MAAIPSRTACACAFGKLALDRFVCTGRVITKRRGYDSITPYQCGGGTMASKGVVQPARRREHDLAARPTTMIPTCHAARYSQKSTWDTDGRTNGSAGRAVGRWANRLAAAAAGEQRAGQLLLFSRLFFLDVPTLIATLRHGHRRYTHTKCDVLGPVRVVRVGRSQHSGALGATQT